jgi:hypothetical protein
MKQSLHSALRNPQSEIDGDPLNLMRLVPPKGEAGGETAPVLLQVGGGLSFSRRGDDARLKGCGEDE